MKKIFFILFLFPLVLSAQLNIETYKGRLNFVELPQVEKAFTLPSRLEKSASPDNPFSVFRLNKQNFREPVSMMDAFLMEEQTGKSNIELNIDPRSYGVYAGNDSYTPDGSTKIKNNAYKEAARGFYVTDNCPPFGICPRCAPYRYRMRY